MLEKTNAGLYVWTLFYLTTILPCFLLAYLKQPTQPTAHMCTGLLARSDKQELSNKIWNLY